MKGSLAAGPQQLGDEKFRLAVESCPTGMLMIERAGEIVLVNREIERAFGYRRDELIGCSIDTLVPESLGGQHAADGDNTHGAETRRMATARELFGRRKDGTEFPVELVLNPVHTPEGLLILGAVVDISERKRMQRLKDDFVSTVSHELRTPLTAIAAALALLAGIPEIKLSETTRRLIAIAHSNSQRLVRLINDILDIEKIESGKVPFRFRCVDVGLLAEQTIEANRPLADACNVALRMEKSGACEVHADPDRLTQVITNLLSNAIKFSRPSTEVTVAVERRGEHVRLSVRDQGPGIPEEFRCRIFEKFAQADASNARHKGGSGLGLTIVKQIVLRLGGDVGFSAAPGGGTVFYVDLPRLVSSKVNAESGLELPAPPILVCEQDGEAAALAYERLRHTAHVFEPRGQDDRVSHPPRR